jgi:hypothetical protein
MHPTSEHPNRKGHELPRALDDLRLAKACGGPISLHRYAGRWVILRVAASFDGKVLLSNGARRLDAVPLNVIPGPVQADVGADHGEPVVFDPMDLIAERFPALDWPATFILDPHGHLVAILTDESYDSFLHELVHTLGPHHPQGTIDGGDITS